MFSLALIFNIFPTFIRCSPHPRTRPPRGLLTVVAQWLCIGVTALEYYGLSDKVQPLAPPSPRSNFKHCGDPTPPRCDPSPSLPLHYVVYYTTW